jgi:hypothetical protein
VRDADANGETEAWLGCLSAEFSARHPPSPPGGRQGRKRARAKLATGRPLLHDERLDLDVGFCVGLARELLTHNWRRGQPDASTALAALTRADLDLERLVEEAFVGHVEHLRQLARPAGPGEEQLVDALTWAVQPLLGLAAEAVAEHLGREQWDRPYCPACGTSGVPDGVAQLCCVRCGTRWAGEYQAGAAGFVLELALPGMGDDEDWRDA